MGYRWRHKITPNKYKYNDLFRKYENAQARIQRDFKRMLNFRMHLGLQKAVASRHVAKTTELQKQIKAKNAEIRKIKKEHHKEFQPYRDKITKLETAVQREKRYREVNKETIKRLRGKISNYHRITKDLQQKNDAYRRELTQLKGMKGFFTQKHQWNINGNTFKVQTETILRTISIYDVLKAEKKITQEEVMYLCTGELMEAFNKSHIENRFGAKQARTFKKTITALMEVGFVERLDRQEAYYLTQKGKNRIQSIVKAIYTAKPITYFK